MGSLVILAPMNLEQFVYKPATCEKHLTRGLNSPLFLVICSYLVHPSYCWVGVSLRMQLGVWMLR